MAEAIHTAARFNDEGAAREHLESIRWPNGPVCPHCGGTQCNCRLNGASQHAGRLLCGDCLMQFSVTVGTAFERSKVAPYKWVYAPHRMCASKKGISSKQLERMLGVTYKSVWFRSNRIRQAMTVTPADQMGGDCAPIEVDEMFRENKGKPAPPARSLHHQIEIVSLVERIGEKRSFHVPRISPKTLGPILNAPIAARARLMTDKYGVYKKMGREFVSHETVNHSAKGDSRGAVTTNAVESSFSLLKHGLVDTSYSVSEARLQRYAPQFHFRSNTRQSLGFNVTDRAAQVLKSIGGKRLRSQQIDA